MSRPNTVMRLLGLSALVVGLMAMSAGAAQAELTGGTWNYIDGSGILKELPNEQNIGGKIEGSTWHLLTEILKKKVEYICTSFTINEGKLIKGGTMKFRLTFHGCITKVGGVTQAACEPNAGGSHSGLFETQRMVALLLLHNGSKVMIIHPETGNTLANIEMSELCSIGEKVPVIGLLALIDCQNEGSVHKVEHLVTEFGALTKLFTISETAEHKATTDGSALVFLTGTNVGLKWAALWN